MGEARRYTPEEEALEIGSLRRIISAYLNYPDAAERDVRKHEKSFKKLQPDHKALLSHLPLKYQRLRWCISMNTSFIVNMLQAFEPPFDMSRDLDNDEQDYSENTHEQYHADQSQHGSFSRGLMSMPESNNTLQEQDNKEGANIITHEPFSDSHDKEQATASSFEPAVESSVTSQCIKNLCNGEKDGGAVADSSAMDCCGSSANENETLSRHPVHRQVQMNVPFVDVDKVRCIIRNIVRDWALEGQKERDECYKPILQELDRLFPDRSKESPPSCLVPGAGLGRLALEVSCLGFASQGNEFSYYMMICSNFILNHTQEAFEWTIYPWIHSNCNSLTDNDQLRPVSFPDIHPSSAGITEGFSMCAGDFLEVYNEENHEASWDAIVTCFFLDTAHNIVEYIEIISKVLKDSGVWINLGPLLYHFADSYGPEDEMSIELSLEDVKKVAYHYGFEMEVEKLIETTYTANTRSMMQNKYSAAFWTMRKKPRAKKS